MGIFLHEKHIFYAEIFAINVIWSVFTVYTNKFWNIGRFWVCLQIQKTAYCSKKEIMGTHNAFSTISTHGLFDYIPGGTTNWKGN